MAPLPVYCFYEDNVAPLVTGVMIHRPWEGNEHRDRLLDPFVLTARRCPFVWTA